MFKQKAAAIVAGLVIFAAAPAFADIKAYNAAVQRGDYPAAAAEVGPIWANYDKASEDAIVVAREFAWMSMLGGRPDQAGGIARWLVEQGPKAPHPDPHPQTSMVLLRWTELGGNPTPKTVKALSDAVAARAAVMDPGDRISAVATQKLYGVEWKLRQWSDAERNAQIAATLSATLGAEGVEYRLQSQMIAAAAEFMDKQEVAPYFKMAEVRQELIDHLGGDIRAIEDNESDTSLYAASNRAGVWMVAMMAYYTSVEPHISKPGWRSDYNRAKALKVRGKCGLEPCPLEPAPGKLPSCEVTYVQKPALRYPSDARMKGIVGAVRLRIKTDEAGNVSAAKLIAAVPSDEFPDPAVSAVGKWTVKKRDDQTAPCTLAGTRLLDFQFMIGNF
jgi:TonB family protein